MSPRSDCREVRDAARRYVQAHLGACAREILEWHRTGLLPSGHVEEVAERLRPLHGEHDVRLAE